MNKKLLLTFGSLASVMPMSLAVVSCHNDKQAIIKEQTQKVLDLANNAIAWNDVTAQIAKDVASIDDEIAKAKDDETKKELNEKKTYIKSHNIPLDAYGYAKSLQDKAKDDKDAEAQLKAYESFYTVANYDKVVAAIKANAQNLVDGKVDKFEEPTDLATVYFVSKPEKPSSVDNDKFEAQKYLTIYLYGLAAKLIQK